MKLVGKGRPGVVSCSVGRIFAREILKELPTRGNTFANGTFWRLDADQATSIAERLTNLGYKVERRDDLKLS
jgi:hypothetical protein